MPRAEVRATVPALSQALASADASHVTEVTHTPVLSMTFDTAGQAHGRAHFRAMEAIATITCLAAATCAFTLIGIIWKHAERADGAS